MTSHTRPPLLHWLLLTLLAGTAHTARADGKFFRIPEVADEPGVHAQRALIAYKDGIETLVVQSDVTGAGASFGWLLPLPAEPTAVEPCPPHCLNFLPRRLAPHAARTPAPFLIPSLAFLLIVVVVCTRHVHMQGRPVTWSSLLMEVFLGALAAVTVLAQVLPSLSLAGSRSGPNGVDVLQTARAGVYEIAVITGCDAQAVSDWLTSNGFVSPPSATTVIEDYLADGWCFLAAKVTPEHTGPVTHHPLKVVFPTPRAVYPLRLTGSDGSPIHLDLYVVGKERAATAKMRTWFCDGFDRLGALKNVQDMYGDYAYETPPVYTSHHTRFTTFAIPTVSDLLWPGCVITRLSGRLQPRDMQQDLYPTWKSPTPTQFTLYTRGQAAGWAAGIAALVCALAFASLTPSAARRRWSAKQFVGRRLPPAIICGLLVGGTFYATREVAALKMSTEHPWRGTISSALHKNALRELCDRQPVLPFPEAYRQLVKAPEPGPKLDELMDLDARGDFSIEPTDDGWRLTIIEWQHIAVTISITPEGVPRLAEEQTSPPMNDASSGAP